MPYVNEWVSNEVAFEIEGVTIYHVYKDNELDQGSRTEHFTLDPEGNEDDDAFDFRELPIPDNYKGPRQPTEFTSKPNDFEGDYQEWTETKQCKSIDARWNDWHKVGSIVFKRAVIGNAIKNEIGPFSKPEKQLPKFKIRVAMNIRAYGLIDVEAETPEAAAAKATRQYVADNFYPHGSGADDFDFGNPSEIWLELAEDEDGNEFMLEIDIPDEEGGEV